MGLARRRLPIVALLVAACSGGTVPSVAIDGGATPAASPTVDVAAGRLANGDADIFLLKKVLELFDGMR